MRCAIYTRVSTDEQTQPEYNSLQTQQEICEHYIQVQREKGWKLTEVYEDEVIPAKTWTARPCNGSSTTSARATLMW